MESGLQPAITVEGLIKHYGAVRALDGVDLQLVAGEVHGIVGENGAGKSTLMKILAGVQPPTSGKLLVRGASVRFHSVQDALQLGIVMIHQELNLVDELSAADNIFLGREPVRYGLIDRGRCASEAKTLFHRIGHELDPARPVYSLSIADKQMVEIAKALSYQASVLIMDEPTATLTERDAVALLALIDQLRSNGVTIVFISHILPQVLQVCDRITVLRDGKVVTTLDKEQVKLTTERGLASLMVGRPMAEYFPPRKPHGESVVLSVESLSVPHLAYDINFEVHRGEIFGLAGLIGAGRTETAEAIVGLRRRSSGRFQLDGKTITIDNPVDAARLGIAYLPEDRKAAGLTLGMDIVDNTTMVSMARYGRVLIDRRGQETAAQTQASRLHLRAGSLSDPVSTLSGGNQQKVLLAKWLEIAPRVLIVDEPTRGVDIGAKEEIYRLLNDLAAQGMTCIMISSEMNELLGLCHRIGVMRSGKLITILDGQSATEDQIIHAAGLEASAAVPS